MSADGSKKHRRQQACYQKPLIPLETVGADYLGLGKVNEQAARNPFPAIRLTDSAKAPRFVRIEDLAKGSTNKPSRHSWQRSLV
ncbi:pyocin activator PrtN family protein [Deefgea tanakiae]|uniref:Pyocin activator PrtN family protein n=1 Tax=Deefgea tanakiae TaxID=2865840 RepID=A0ABX8Z1L4_9NEIS|nr:pyocin activator PrtN family protein [Deefgea tanakiae]QZA76468.1 pyocin activator PrtN family protein [Deefgea tanakiae]